MKNKGGEVSVIIWPTVSVMGVYCNIKMLSQSWETESHFQCSLGLVEFYTILKCEIVARYHDLAISNSIACLVAFTWKEGAAFSYPKADFFLWG